MTSYTPNRITASKEVPLPHNFDVEHQIIGLTLAAQMSKRPGVWREFCEIQPEDFFHPIHQGVWGAIRRLHDAKKPVDIATVLGEVTADSGGEDDRSSWEMKRLLCECAGNIVTWENSAHYAALLRDMAEKRRMVYACLTYAENAATAGYTSPAADVAGSAIADLQARIGGKRELVGPRTLIDNIVKSLDQPVFATPTGLPRLDAALRGGFHRGRFYGLGADQKAGKTTLLASTISYNMARARRPHVYIGLEMRSEEIFQRYLARYIAEETGADTTTDIFYDRRQTSDPAFRELLAEAAEEFDEAKSGLWFLQRPRMHIDELKATLARIGLSGQYEGVIIDYMQLVGGSKGENMTLHLDNVAQTIAEFVATYPIWVCAAAQMNQGGNIRGGNGMRAAVDMLLGLNKIEFTDEVNGGPPFYKAWIAMQASRYTPVFHIGTELEPAYDFNISAGPSYKELPRPNQNLRNFMQGARTSEAPQDERRRH